MKLSNKVVISTDTKTKLKLSFKILIFILVVVASFILGYFLSGLGNNNKKDIITEKNLNDVIESDWITPKGTKGEVAIYESFDTKMLIIDRKDESSLSLSDENLYKKKYTYKRFYIKIGIFF